MIQSLSRRRFLAIIGIGTGIAAAGSVLAHRLGLRVLEGVNAQLQLALEPGLKDAPRGTLGEEAVRTLVATTEALVGSKIKPDHYEAFFRWRAETLSGYRSLYERFVSVVDGAAKERGETGFIGSDMEVRRDILLAITPKTFELVFRREGLRFERYIFRQILELFSATDAWIWLGYQAWPGTPRGLDSYTKAPLST